MRIRLHNMLNTKSMKTAVASCVASKELDDNHSDFNKNDVSEFVKDVVRDDIDDDVRKHLFYRKRRCDKRDETF